MNITDNFSQYIEFQLVLSELKERGNNKAEQGTLFELFCKKVLLTSPFFSDDVSEVWTWREFPGNAGKHDTGIDLVVKDKQGLYWAVQCKFYDKDSTVSKADIDSFISASTRKFRIDNQEYEYSQRLVFSTTDNISLNASGLFTTIGPETLLECGIDWKHFSLDDIDAMKIVSKKSPKPHQLDAIQNCVSGFKNNNRGRLVMACGTGKTFTSLKIVEALYNEEKKTPGFNYQTQFNILYLVPSIALLSQTIIEWKTQQEFTADVRTFGICSDETAGQTKKKKRTDEDVILVQMPIPATTDVNKISNEYKRFPTKINIFFSTYQSIDVVSEVAKRNDIIFDIAICDEAHRTIGAYKQNDDETSNFVKIHDDNFVPCKKRLYMTATEKIYSSNAKQEAEEGGWNVYSMDDEKVYGPEFYYLSFGEAVTKQLLTDYRLLVLNIRKSDVAKLKLPESAFENLDDASRIVGSLTALSKIPSELSPDEFIQDPNPMKRAVAFCSTIAQAKAIAESYNHLADNKCLGKEYMLDQGFVIPKAKLITGQNNTREKNKLLDWLRGDIDDGTCHILTNARCLSEGVDVPSLDCVIFMAKKRSQVDIIQAVGRVMRKFGSGSEKKYGYIVIPVVINDEKLTDKTLSNNEEYKVVWQVVQALRSHDERLDTEINKIGVTGKMPNSICFVNTFVPPRSKKGTIVGSRKRESEEGWDTDDPTLQNDRVDFSVSIPSDEELRKNEQLFSAQLVKHCGNRLYWEDWSKNIGDVTNNVALKIKQQIDTEDKAKKSFTKFLEDFKKLLNPGISELDAINMLAEHVVTLPVLKAIFNENSMIDNNPVTQIMESMVKKLRNLNKEIEELNPFYESVKKTVEGVTSSEGRQEIIRKLFEKFFQYALPASAEKFGIVYTPVEIVDFIINSVTDALKNEFNEKITSPNIKILDPFTGTGTFIVRVLDKFKELGISKEDLKEKYEKDIWCNEIMLLAYYIALVNIEDTYGKLSGEYEPFTHAVLTDTFQMAEKRISKFYQTALFEEEEFSAANEKAKEEDETDIRIIVGNPPYSVGQKNAMDNNANSSYDSLDYRINNTYAKNTKSQTIRSLYDSYVRAFRWASDRIGDDGIISFVSNGSYIDNLAFSGFRRELLNEFNHVYIFNLRGNQRTQGELSRKEGGKIFGSGSRNTICIILLIKHKGKAFDGFIHYHDIGDYLSREEKLKKVADFNSMSNIEWQEIYPDKDNDWINKKDSSFEKFISLGDKKTGQKSIFSEFYSRGIGTSKDAWMYNFNEELLHKNINKYIDFYETESSRIRPLIKSNNQKDKLKDAMNLLNLDPTKIKWDADLIVSMINGKHIRNSEKEYRIASYRPFTKTNLCWCIDMFQRIYRFNNIFPEKNTQNIVIAIAGIGNKQKFSALVSNVPVDLGYLSAAQAFPLYWYEETSNELNLFNLLDDNQTNEKYNKNYAISDDYLSSFKGKYGNNQITHEDIFYYIYGLFHSNKYKEKYSANLSKEFPRIPYLKRSEKYIEIGKKLADLHLNYENQPAYEGVKIDIKKEDYTVNKIRFLSKDRMDTIIFNENIKMSNIPLEVYDYKVNGRSPIEWILDQYQYTVDKDSGIINDPNKYDEVKGGKYVFDLILSLITVSLETLKLIDELPPYEEIDEGSQE